MMQTVGFAAAVQENELNRILSEHNMGLAGELEEHVVIIADGKVLGGGLLWQLDVDLFHLLALGVDQECRNRGTGHRLLTEICSNPWKYCRDASDCSGSEYRITTMARGTAVSFYQKCGFKICDPSELSAPFGDQCVECPDRIECSPEAMIFTGKISLQEGKSTDEGDF
jgi:N-acetylglutamate synthase-like GNAT family acetyltransferase